MAATRTFAGKARVRQAHRRDADLLFQIPMHKGFRCILIPVRKPGENQQMWTLDFPILSGHGKWLSAHADAAHHPLAAGPQVRLHVRDHEPPFGAPPSHTLAGISKCLKDRAAGPSIVIS